MDLARALEGVVLGLYVGGSLATGDYRNGISDIDAVALIHRSPTPATRSVLTEAHQRLAHHVDGGDAVHCVYVPSTDAVDVTSKHWTWAFGELFRRPLSGIARGELLTDPIVVFGPNPTSWLPPLGLDALREAARAELAGYWTRALRKRSIWLQDVYVDIGLTVWARADATIKDGTLITKTEAIARLAGSGVPQDIVDGIACRRQGEQVHLGEDERQARAVVVREFLTQEIARLIAPARGEMRQK
jgi:hypothetical protein